MLIIYIKHIKFTIYKTVTSSICFFPVLFYSFLFYWKRTGTGKHIHYWIFFQVWLSCVFARRKNAGFSYIKWYFSNEIKVFNKAERCDWIRTGARKSHTLLNFFSSLIIMCFCAAQEHRILLNKMIIFKWKQSF